MLLAGGGLLRGAIALASKEAQGSLPRRFFSVAGGFGLLLFWGPLLGVGVIGATGRVMTVMEYPTRLPIEDLSAIGPLLIGGGILSFAFPTLGISYALGETALDSWPSSWRFAVFARCIVYSLTISALAVFLVVLDPEVTAGLEELTSPIAVQALTTLGVSLEALPVARLLLAHSLASAVLTLLFAGLIIHDENTRIHL